MNENPTHPAPSHPKRPRQIGSKGQLAIVIPCSIGPILGLVSLCWFHVGAAGFSWSLACLSAGSLLGIIFGIPRQMSDPSSANTAHASPWLRANTNMEEISDWLTKLLVGAGLVELKSAPEALKSAAKYLAASLPPFSRSQATLESIAASMIIYFTVQGFIGGYLVTRVFFQIAFFKSDEILHQGK